MLSCFLHAEGPKKMSRTSREKGLQANTDGCENADSGKFSTKSRPSSRQWSAFKNPRIVRVSRAFGGKDRHSKVCTIRGLKDRRIRLSVHTAIQLYDLQDRLGLDQPSKAVDWLLDTTKSDIDKLPPLPIPPTGNFPQSSFFSENLNGGFQSLLSSSKEEAQNHRDQSGGNFNYIPQVSAKNFFPMATHSSLTNALNNVVPPYNFYSYSEPSALSVSHFEIHGLFPSQPTGVSNTTPYNTRQINYHLLRSIGPPAVSASTSKFLHPHLPNDEREHDSKGNSTAS